MRIKKPDTARLERFSTQALNCTFIFFSVFVTVLVGVLTALPIAMMSVGK